MKVSTSILSSDDRINCVQKLNRTNTSYIHIDVMDGKFVSDKQFLNVKEVRSLDWVAKYPLDVHLMVKNPIEYIGNLSNLDIAFITVHVEIGKNINKIVNMIHKMGYKAGLAINPNNDIKCLEKYLGDIDVVLVMSVEPGKGGQKFIESTVDRIKRLKELIGDRNVLIEVDGGINNETVSLVKDADIVVSGSYVVKNDNYYKAIESLIHNKEDKKNTIKKSKKSEKNSSVDNVKKIIGNFFGVFLFVMLVYFVVLILM